jgi:uncharacterized protein
MAHMRRRAPRAAAVALACVAALVTAGCAGADDTAATGQLSIATGNTAGPYFEVGGGLARLISSDVEGYQATAEATAGSVENIELVVRGDSDIGFASGDAAADAVAGVNAFRSPQPINALARTYSNTVHLVVRSERNASRIEDLRGLRVSTGSPGSSTELAAIRLLEAAEMQPGDIIQQKLSMPESVQGMQQSSLDAMVWSGGLPTSGISELMTALGSRVELLDLSPYLETMRTKFGDQYQPGTIGADVYGLPADVPSISVPNLIVVRDTMSDNLAYDLTKVLVENRDDLAAIHTDIAAITPEQAAQAEPVPLHPGSQRFYET